MNSLPKVPVILRLTEDKGIVEENEELKFDITVGNNEYRFITDNIGLSDMLEQRISGD